MSNQSQDNDRKLNANNSFCIINEWLFGKTCIEKEHSGLKPGNLTNTNAEGKSRQNGRGMKSAMQDNKNYRK